MEPHESSPAPVLHLVHDEPDATVLAVMAAQQAKGLAVELVRCDRVTDWGSVVDKVLKARSVCSW
ncbi:MAG: hypothetical protein WCR07_00190 [Verrucomicrobiota bacterium]|jgi:hypothetical protein